MHCIPPVLQSQACCNATVHCQLQEMLLHEAVLGPHLRACTERV